MTYLLQFAFLFLAIIYPSHGQTELTPDVPNVPDVPEERWLWYDVGRPIVVNCTLNNTNNLQIQWLINGTAVEAKGRYEVRREGVELVVTGKSGENDYGNYTCRAGDEEVTWALRGRPHAKMAANTNAVEGQRLKLSCRVVGKPRPAVGWLYSNDTLNATDALLALSGRARTQPNEQGVPDAELVVEVVMREDAGEYTCRAGEARAATTVRVKDMYAALWPFLGICAEVFVLCAIILVYERRRTKPELDDSDTDNHDQKKS